MCLNLNGNFSFPFIHLRRVLSELHSGNLSDPLSYVRCLLRAGGGDLLISYAFCNTDISGSQYGHDVNCSNKDVSLSCKLRLFGCVRNSLVIDSFIMLIVVHNRSSVYDSNKLRMVSTRVRSKLLSRLMFVRRTEINQCSMSSLSQSDVVQS